VGAAILLGSVPLLAVVPPLVALSIVAGILAAQLAVEGVVAAVLREARSLPAHRRG
jgi:hypothetical protein